MSAAPAMPIGEGLFTWPAEDPRLLGSRCLRCGIVSFPAQASCAACSGQEAETIELAKRGTLWTFTVQAFMPKRPPYDGPETAETFEPYGVGYVELPEQLRVETRIRCRDPYALEIGMEMELVVDKYIERDGRDVVAFFFTPVAEIQSNPDE